MNDHDISISALINWIGESLLFFKGLIQLLFNKIIRNPLLTIVLVAIGSTLGFMLGSDEKSETIGGITCTYTELHRKTYGEMIKSLNESVLQHQSNLTAELLHISSEAANSLKWLKATNVAGASLEEDLNPEKLPFYITYAVDDIRFCKEINAGLLTYLQQCDYNKTRRMIRLQAAKEKAGYLDHQIAQLDSIKRGLVEYFRTGRSSNTEPVEVKPEQLYKQSIDLFNEKQAQEWSLVLDNSVEIIYEHVPKLKVTPSDKYKKASIGFMGGLILALMLGLAKKYD